MAEQLFAQLARGGASVSPLTGATGTLTNLYIRGTHAETGTARSVKINGVEKVLTDHLKRRGMNVINLDKNFNVISPATYDIYGSDVSRDQLADRILSIPSDEIAILTSYDAIISNSKLDKAFESLRSTLWSGLGDLGYRISYACVICGEKNAVVSEKMIGRGLETKLAEIELALSDPTKIGYSGFGKSIISDEDTHSNNVANSSIVKWLDKTPLTTENLIIGDSVSFKSMAKLDSVSALTNSYVRTSIIFHNSSDGVISEVHKDITSIEGWEEFELRTTIPAACTKISVLSELKSDSTRGVRGYGYVKMTSMQLSDNSQEQVTNDVVKLGVFGSQASEYGDSLGNFGHYDPKGYYEAYHSEANLYRNVAMPQHTEEPVRWFDRILDKDNERVVYVGDGNFESIMPKVDVDPTKFYYGCIWVNKHQKTKGPCYIGTNAYSEDGASIGVRNSTGEHNGNPYFQYPNASDLEQNQWLLLQGFFLPHDISLEDSAAFIEKYSEYYGWDDVFGTGIGVSDPGNTEYGCIMYPNTKKVILRFLDFYNEGSPSKTLWALPILREIKIMSLDLDDGLLTSIDLTT